MTFELILEGVTVRFPYQPYNVQETYMIKVLACLKEKKCGLLESPTGTGKTLALLCASLAWLENIKMKNFGDSVTLNKAETIKSIVTCNKIIYASRTHSQLTQVISEYKRSGYANTSRCAILGSREQLCLNQAVLEAPGDKNQLCRSKIKSLQTCEFYSNVEKIGSVESKHSNNDIEGLKTFGQRRKVCPYYLSRDLCKDADIIFMPYNYLLDANIRKTMSFDLAHCVVILDEAHNVLQNCEDSSSLNFECKDIALALSDLDFAISYLESDYFNSSSQYSSVSLLQTNLEPSVPDITVSEICLLKECLMKFETTLIKFGQQKFSTELMECSPGDQIVLLMNESGITEGNFSSLTQLIEKVLEFLSAVAISITGVTSRSMGSSGKGLQKMSEVFAANLCNNRQFVAALKVYYRLHVGMATSLTHSISSANANKSQNSNYIFNLWCFSASFCMRSLMQCNIRSIILTSGTLKPMDPFRQELGLDFQVVLQNQHVIKTNQLLVRAVFTGPDDVTLSSAYKSRNDPGYLRSLGMSLIAVSREVPGGLLVFFSSYAAMNTCLQFWQSDNGASIWRTLNDVKPVFVEPRSKGQLPHIIGEFRRAVASQGGGATLMAVCRGKVSEGIDFADKDARCVVITGIPFPSVNDARVLLKKKYCDFQCSQRLGLLSGSSWYNLEAFRAVNQAIGRVIRHKDDYGAILFFDNRFGEAGIREKLPHWINEAFSKSDFRQMTKSIGEFFERHSAEQKTQIYHKSSLYSKERGHRGVEATPSIHLCKKRKRIVLKSFNRLEPEIVVPSIEESRCKAVDFVSLLKSKLTKEQLSDFKQAIKQYRATHIFTHLTDLMDAFVNNDKLNVLSLEDLVIFRSFVMSGDQEKFDIFLNSAKNKATTSQTLH